jgi:hypothetical protein
MAQLLKHSQVIAHGEMLYDFPFLQPKAVNMLHHPQTARLGTRAVASCLLASAGFLCRSRAEKNLAHLARRSAGDGTLARPRQRFVHISGFKYPETAYVFLGLCERPVGDEHFAVGLGPQRLGVAGRGEPAGELPRAGSNHFTVERVYRLDSRFGFDGRS